MNVLAGGVSWIDLNFVDRPHAIATAVIRGAGSVALIDPGPSTCLDTLELGLESRGLRFDDVTHLLLTHIHLDHAGAAGTIVREHPHITVLVHERGAKHMIDPSRLLDSATRLYGRNMDRLWGEFAAVPQSKIVSLSGGERIDAGGRTFEVAYTPGHASHHVSYFDESSGVALVGDVAGVCASEGYVLPPTPPPDIDLELWRTSADRILEWSPSTLFLTHFGPVTRVRPHLAELFDNLAMAAAAVRESLTAAGSDDEKSERFADWLRQELRKKMTDVEVDAYIVAAEFRYLWFGLARYWRKRLGM